MRLGLGWAPCFTFTDDIHDSVHDRGMRSTSFFLFSCAAALHVDTAISPWRFSGNKVCCRHHGIKCAVSDDMPANRQKLIADLQAGLGSWSDFDDANDQRKGPPSRNAARVTTKRKGKDGKLYLRDGPKRPVAVTKLSKKRQNVDLPDTTDGSESGLAAHSVRIEEAKAGGKKLTIIRGFESVGRAQVLTILKGLKSALAVGGRVTKLGQLELQGAHGELCLVRLQALGCRDVRLAGAATPKSSKPLAWNAPQEIRERAAAAKQAATKAKRSQAKAKRAAARSPEAVAAAMLCGLRESEQVLLAKMRRSDLPKAEKRSTADALERVQQRIVDASASSS